MACPVDTNVGKKEQEKVAKYTGLRVELEKMWGMNAETVPVIVGAITRNLGHELSKIPGSPDRFMCKKISLLKENPPGRSEE